ncbi:hydroxymethylglutaryl-CoA lyase [Mesorhizobium sp. AD1-1]|uniref:hydroxymethylglutaryl-CoA lyase n=1 Tax=Mesorhizobium sp. AD1-1 TaxID=2876621 RepID=UPI001CCF9D94|nr:hydroxymethylglutaryl-CoA lyase [Mesorhizobium sp. AD1-1]MBZ9719673.1 hydroxymethylglutaryl-CoA lyase [Mesorhizobium sp. AD1-1]
MNPAVVICECFARDGLQHEPAAVPTHAKIAVIDAITSAGFSRIEATSYSHPTLLPAFADASDVLRGIQRREGVTYKATCPNQKAIERALVDLAAGSGAGELSLLVSATEAHTERNLRTTRERQWRNVADMAALAGGRFRLIGVVSMAFGCPFEGRVDLSSVLDDIAHFASIGVRHVTVGDTSGHGTPSAVRRMFEKIALDMPEVTAIAHFHDTRGTALANCLAAYEAGCRWFDSALGGVGGHPVQIQYGEGQTGNVATEDLINLFEAEGIDTGLDLERLRDASLLCEKTLGRELYSKVARAGYGVLN